MKSFDLEKIIFLSKKLANKVKQTYKPDVVFVIANGGIVLGIEISKQLKLPLEIIEIRRKHNKELISKYEYATHEDRKKISEEFDNQWFASDPELIKGMNRDIANKNVLLVDDAVHTGKTLVVANNYINSLQPKQIKTAALFFIKDVKPDYYLGQGEYRYPWTTWAKFYPEYEDLKKYLKRKEQYFR